MNTNYTPVQAVYRVTKRIYFALIIGLLFFALVVFYISAPDFFFKIDLSDPYLIPGIMLTCISIPGGLFVFKSALNKIQPHEGLKEKIQKYQVLLIIKTAACEGPGLFAVVCFLLTSNLFYLVILALVLAVMLSYYPSATKIASEIHLSQNEIFELESY